MKLKEWLEQNQDKEVRIGEDGSISITEKEKPGRWMPKRGDIYWVIYGDGDPGAMEWKDGMYDQARCSIGNVFKNKPEAKSAVERMMIRAELLDCGGKETREIVLPRGSFYDYRYAITVDNSHNVVYCLTAFLTPFEITFETEDEAKAAIKKVGEDRIKKYLFGIEG